MVVLLDEEDPVAYEKQLSNDLGYLLRNGNKYLAWAFVEAANFAIRYNPRVKRFYQRKKDKTNGMVALKAVAHKCNFAY